MAQKLFQLVRQQVEDFESKRVQLLPNWSFNQQETLRRIEYYRNSQFESGEFDSEGFKKFFFNVNRFPCDIETKATDLDTKDFRYIPDFPLAEVPTLLLAKELRQWMRQGQFGQVINEIVENRPIYGSVVVKKTVKGLENVPLANLYNDQSADSLKDGPCLEKHAWSPDELRRQVGWDQAKIEKVIAAYATYKPGDHEIIVWEGYRWLEEDTLLYNNSKKLVFGFFVVAGIELVDRDKIGNITFDHGELLASQIIDPETDWPYRENHRRRVKGRWLGVGKTEELFDPQVKLNELENIETKMHYLTGKVVFQSRDETVVKNLLLDLTNGDILKSKSPIEQVGMRTLDGASLDVSKRRWSELIQRNSFTFESQTGETMPSGTPFALGRLLTSVGGGFFDFQREQIGLFFKELFFDVIIPSFKKDKNKKHLVSLPSDDKDREDLLNKYVEFSLFNRMNTMSLDELMNFDVASERQRLMQSAQSRKNLHVELPDAYYDDAKFNMELVITDESMNLNQRLESLSTLIQLILPNPSVLNDPRVRALVFAATEAAGFNPRELGLAQTVTPPAPVGPALSSGNPAGPAGAMPFGGEMRPNISAIMRGASPGA